MLTVYLKKPLEFGANKVHLYKWKSTSIENTDKIIDELLTDNIDRITASGKSKSDIVSLFLVSSSLHHKIPTIPLCSAESMTWYGETAKMILNNFFADTVYAKTTQTFTT